MITTVYYDTDEGKRFVVGTFLMSYDAEHFIRSQSYFKDLKTKDLPIGAWSAWQLIIDETNKTDKKV